MLLYEHKSKVEVFIIMNKKFLVSATAAALVASAVVPGASAANFTDIDKTGDHKENILALADAGIINGYPEGLFKPGQNVTRGNVVKLLGKWLEKQGKAIPKDALEKERFTDLPVTIKDQELIKYAALVKDANVFTGVGGVLNQADSMSREHMSLVLTRVIKEVYGLDAVKLAKDAKFKSEMTDISKLAQDRQDAIMALEYLEITKPVAGKYNPANKVQRMQFASFLKRTMDNVQQHLLKVTHVHAKTPTLLDVTLSDDTTHEVKLNSPLQPNVNQTIKIVVNDKEYMVEVEYGALSVKAAKATSATTAEITLSDDTTHNIDLPKPLEENVATEINFMINEVGYKAVVMHTVAEVKVVQVTTPNSMQVAVKFNQEIDAKTIDAQKINLAPVGQAKLTIKEAKLDETKRTLLLTVTKPLSADSHVLQLQDIKATSGIALANYETLLKATEDKTAPKVTGQHVVNALTTEVFFSEPMKKFAAIQYKLADGTAVTRVAGQIAEGATSVTIDLKNAKANNKPLDPGTKVIATFIAAQDMAGNLISPNPTTVTIQKGNKDGVPPALLSAVQDGPNRFKLTFSEPLITTPELKVRQDNKELTPTIIEEDKNQNTIYYLTIPDAKEGDLQITSTGITDLSGETNTVVQSVKLTVDKTLPTVSQQSIVNVNGVEYLEVTYDRPITVKNKTTVTAKGKYEKAGLTTDFTSTEKATVTAEGDKAIRIKLADLLKGHDQQDAIYNVELTLSQAVASEYNIDSGLVIPAKFTRGADSYENKTELKLVAMPFSTPNNNTVVITFDGAVEPLTAKNLANYKIDSAEIKSVEIKSGKQDQVYLTLEPNKTTFTGERDITIEGIHAKGSSIPMQPVKTKITLKSNIAPTLVGKSIVNDAVILTFSENVQKVGEDDFIIKNDILDIVNTKTVKGQNANEVRINLTTGNLVDLGQTITVQLNDKATLVDSDGNTPVIEPFTLSTVK